ncbi:MAG: hypothetical protein V8R00_00390 [Coprococcus catus]
MMLWYLFLKERYPDYQKVCTDYAGCCGIIPPFMIWRVPEYAGFWASCCLSFSAF